ncbi:glycosyltransferase [Aestuariimicrobium ganziense]|uniref:glycosyltransferase n=1 Tax=Aestuariimicrobium ganziense TaxID=2773677 RepID=UPI00194171E2|nr:glycosyltransferase [Aestuariimicrobium ganziense]
MTDERSAAPQAGDDDLWGWAHDRDDAPPAQVEPEQVATVLVVHNGEGWLPRTLRALAALDQRPGWLVAVDAASTDGSRALLEQALEEGVVDDLLTGPSSGFGDAAAPALEVLADHHRWIWFLHDDLEPRPDALTALLRAAAAQSRPDLLFPKLLAPRRRNHPDLLLEIGQSISTGSRRVLSVEPGDIDQHQQEPTATLGGSTAGLLISRNAWESLEGFDPDLPLFRDAVDLGWRANDAGLTVVTVPEAALHHHQVGRWGDRESAVSDDLPLLDRLSGQRLLMARSPRPTLTALRLSVVSLLTALVMLLGKNLADARTAWRSAGAVLRDRKVVHRMRGRREAQPHGDESGTSDSVSGSAALRPGLWARLAFLVSAGAGAFTDRYREARDDSSGTSLDDLTGDDFTGGRTRARLLAPTTALLVALALLTLWAARSKLWAGSLTSPHLLPAPAGPRQAFAAWLEPAAGHPGPNAPWLGLAALGSWLTAGMPELLVRLVVLGAPLWAGLTFSSLARTLVRRRGSSSVRPDGWQVGLLSAAWGVLVAVLGLVSRGSVTAIAVAVVAPLAASALLRWFDQDRRDSTADLVQGEIWRAPGLLALWLALLGTAQPAFWLVALVVAVVHAVAARRFTGRTLVVGLLPALLSAPWWWRLAAQPARLLTAADPTAAVAAAQAPRPLALAAGRLGEGAPAAWASLAVFAVLWLAAAVVAAVDWRAGRRHGAALLGLALALIALGGWLGRQVVTVDGAPVRPLPDTWVVLAMFVLLTSVLLLVTRGRNAADRPGRDRTDPDRAERVRPDRDRPDRDRLGLLVAIVVSAAVVAGAVGWQLAANQGPLRLAESQLPAHVTSVQDSPRATRTLMVQVRPSGLTWNLTSADSPRWGTGEQHPAGGTPEWASTVQALVGQIAAATPAGDFAQQLSALGIGHVWVNRPTTEQLTALTNTQGLVAAPADRDTTVFTVSGLVSRARVLPEGQTDPVNLAAGSVDPGTTGRLVVAETPDPRWRVEVGGQRVTGAHQQVGATAFSVPLGGQSGTVSWATAPSTWAGVWEGAVLLVLLVLAAPTLGRQRLGRPTARHAGGD